MAAKFRTIKNDPEGSGMDYIIPIGSTIINAERCCNNCSVIFGSLSEDSEQIGFTVGELEPLNCEARDMLRQVEGKLESMKR